MSEDIETGKLLETVTAPAFDDAGGQRADVAEAEQRPLMVTTPTRLAVCVE